MPNEKLASSLEVLRCLQRDRGNILRSNELSRTHRERLKKNGFLDDIISGWLVITRPQDRPHDSTFRYFTFREFCCRYCQDRFGENWCFSAAQSLLLHAESPHIPTQVVLWSPEGSGNYTKLPFNTSLYDLKKDLPEAGDLITRDGLRLLSAEVALTQIPKVFFTTYPAEVQIVLSSLKSINPLLAKLLDGGHVLAAGRITGALRRSGRDDDADAIVRKMRAADYDVRERNPFAEKATIPALPPGTSPLASRIFAAWAEHRQTVLDVFPAEPGLTPDKAGFLSAIDHIYVNDAYHSLSIEGYSVTEELIEEVRAGHFDPGGDEQNRKDVDALAASGYWTAFQSVKGSIERILSGEPAGAVARQDHDAWFEALFQPSVTAGILKASALVGYRSRPVYLRGSRHTPPRAETVTDGMEALFECLVEEPFASVRAVLGHWILGHIHPYPDGNGRMARFLMNAMLASGGYPWTIIEVDQRETYMRALEAGSVEGVLRPLAEFIVDRLRHSTAYLTWQSGKAL